MAIASTQPRALFPTDVGAVALAAAVVAATAWFVLPALGGAITEGFQATLLMNAAALLHGEHASIDPLYQLDNDFFFATRLGVSAVLAGLLRLGLSGEAAFRVVMLASLVALLAANAAILVRRYAVHPVLACVPALLFPGLFESAWFFNDNVLSAALSSAAVAAVWLRRDLAGTALAAMLWGLAVACRTDAVLLAPAFLALLWFERAGWRLRLRHAAVALPIAVAVPFLVYAAFGLDFLDVLALTRRATAAWARSDPWRHMAMPVLKGLSLPGCVLLGFGAWAVVAQRSGREIVLCLAVPLLYALAYGRMLTEIRYLLPLSPFLGILMVEGARAALRLRPARRRVAAAAFGVALLACFAPPLLLPGMAALSTDHDMPRPSLGRFWSPVLGRWWTGTLRDGEAAIGTAVAAEAQSGPTPGVVVSSYWTPDRMVDFTLRAHGFAAAPMAGLPAACGEIGELFTRGPARLLHLRPHIPMLPTQREAVTWERLGAPCLQALGLAPDARVLMVGWMQVKAPPAGLGAGYVPALDLPGWAGGAILAETYAYDVARVPAASVPALLTPARDAADLADAQAAIDHRAVLQ